MGTPKKMSKLFTLLGALAVFGFLVVFDWLAAPLAWIFAAWSGRSNGLEATMFWLASISTAYGIWYFALTSNPEYGVPRGIVGVIGGVTVFLAVGCSRLSSGRSDNPTDGSKR